MTNYEPINCPILESVRTGRRSNRTKLPARLAEWRGDTIRFCISKASS